MIGMGNLSLIVSWFRDLKSTHSRQVWSFFLTRRMGEEYGLQLGQMTPILSISLTICSTMVFCKEGKW